MLLKTTTPADGAGAGVLLEKGSKSSIPPETENSRRARAAALLAQWRTEYVALRMADASNKLLRQALAGHCGQRRYLEALVVGGPRYALDGSVCGEVTEPQREVARARLEQARKLEAPALRLPTRPILSLAKRRGGAS